MDRSADVAPKPCGCFFGLKDVGSLSDVPPPFAAGDLRTSDRVGIFTIRAVCDQEVLLEII